MYKLTVENDRNERLTLTQNKNYVVRDIDGLTPPKVVINSAVVALNDGAIFNSARVETRNIILLISPRFPVEANRTALYKYFPLKKKVRLYYETAEKKIFIDGYVDSVDGSLFELTQTLTISLTCLNPYFKDQTSSVFDMSTTIDLFEFPFSISEAGIEFSQNTKTATVNVPNYGSVDVGMVIEMSANGNVSNPKVYNSDTQEMFGLNINMVAGDKITINTNKNEKSVTLLREGEETNIINQVMSSSVWLQLSVGDNVFIYECDTGEDLLEVRFEFNTSYVGV